MYPYMDNIFHAQISRDSLFVTRDASVHLHLELGFVIDLAKSSLIPSQVMTYLGAWIYTLNSLVRPLRVLRAVRPGDQSIWAIPSHTCR